MESSMLGVGVLLVGALLIIFNYFGWKYYQRFDWTRSELYSLSEKSRSMMSTLDRDIEAVVFMSPSAPLFDSVIELLSRYDAASPHFSTRVVDPAKNLIEAQTLVDKFQLSQVDVVVLDRGDDQRIIEGVDLAEYDYSGLQFGQGPEMTGFKGEQAFTGAILELIEDNKPKILFTVGHGERRLDEFSSRGLSRVGGLLEQDNFQIEEWASLGEARVPEGTDLVIVAGPTSNFIEPELAALATYVDGGGRLLAFLDPVIGDSGPGTTGLEELLGLYGVDVGFDIVVDPSNPIPFYGAETIFINAYGEHPATRSLDQAAIPVILPLARSVVPSEDAPEDLDVRELLITSPQGWGETDLDALERVELDGEDVEGPVSVAVAVSSRDDSDGATLPGQDASAPEDEVPADTRDAGLRLMVFGDSDLVTNAQLVNVGNTELVLNSVNWLVERENLIGIPPKSPEQVRLSLSGSQLRSMAWLVFGVLPGLSILVGVFVFVRRRR
jgi:ABC-type uncharacterized transport system involved in gliding motility auxiliary subunit